MREIPLSQGKVSKVDDELFEFLSQWNWAASRGTQGNWYAVRQPHSAKTKSGFTTRSMHREIADFKGVLERLDHKNRDGLDNQWENLRPASLSQNMANRTSFQGSSSKYKGVDWYRKTQKWRAQIRQNNRGFHIGYFFFEEDAARAYDEQARLRFGEFARLNFPATPSELPATVS